MRLRELLAWQWEGYPGFHQDRRNLLVHAVAVPLFLVGNVSVAVGLALLAPWVAAAGAVLSLAAFAAQGLGHRREPVPPVPFRGVGDAALRIVLEQWVTFPRFVASGLWLRNLRAARRAAPNPRGAGTA
jgi:hypothetical protein